jgi:hypothetical protein
MVPGFAGCSRGKEEGGNKAAAGTGGGRELLPPEEEEVVVDMGKGNAVAVGAHTDEARTHRSLVVEEEEEDGLDDTHASSVLAPALGAVDRTSCDLGELRVCEVGAC